MENTKIISIVGLERGDYPYFLTKAFEEKKYRVLTIDNSSRHEVFLSLKRDDEEADYVERGRCVFMRNKCVEEDETEALEKFDIVIVFHGMNVDDYLLEISDKVIFTTDYLPFTVNEISSYVDMQMIEEVPKENLFVIYRDKVGNKLDEKYILRQYGLTAVENEAAVDYDEGNYNAYVNYCYNGSQQLKGISSEMKAAINLIKTVIVGEEKKKKKKKEKGGKK